MSTPFPHASQLDHTPRAGDTIELDDGRVVSVVNSNGRSHWFHAREIDSSGRETGESFMCLYSTYNGRG